MPLELSRLRDLKGMLGWYLEGEEDLEHWLSAPQLGIRAQGQGQDAWRQVFLVSRSCLSDSVSPCLLPGDSAAHRLALLWEWVGSLLLGRSADLGCYRKTVA